jgi:hypothetical protein
MSFYDLFKNENDELTIYQICKRLNIIIHSSQYFNLMLKLKECVDLGIFTRRLIKNPIRKLGYRKYVYAYKPKEWVLNSICNGFYEKNIKIIESEFKK